MVIVNHEIPLLLHLDAGLQKYCPQIIAWITKWATV